MRPMLLAEILNLFIVHHDGLAEADVVERID